MKLFFDKTIEDMANEGYKPVLGAGIVVTRGEITVDAEVSVKFPEDQQDILLNLCGQKYPSSEVDQIEAIVFNTTTIACRTDGTIAPTPLSSKRLFRRRLYYYPFVLYARS